MKIKLQQIVIYIIGAALVVSGVILAGSLNPLTTTDQTNFVTLEDIYQKTQNFDYVLGSHNISYFSPVGNTMHSIEDVWYSMKSVTIPDVSDVRTGVTYGYSNNLSGTMQPNCTPGSNIPNTVYNGPVVQDKMNPTFAPGATMFTLEDLYQKTFTYQYHSNGVHDVSTSSAPESTMHSLQDIWDSMMNISVPDPVDVRQGVYYGQASNPMIGTALESCGYQIPNNGLVGYWKLDESSGDAIDSVGQNNLINHGATYSTGKVNNGADVGSGNTSKYLGINNNLGIDGGQYSVSAWVKIPENIPQGGQYQLVEQGSNNSFVNYWLQYIYWNETPQLVFGRQRQNVANDFVYYNKTLIPGNWYHLALTYDGTTVIGYVDGISVGTVTSTGNGSGATTDHVYLFAQMDGNLQPYIGASGMLDEVAIYNRALSSQEILEMYAGQAGITLSYDANILSFSIPATYEKTVIDNNQNTVSLTVPTGTALGNVNPSISVSPGATISPLASQVQDFSNQVIYTVTAQNGTTTKQYIVSVSVFDDVTPPVLTGFDFNPKTIDTSLGQQVVDFDVSYTDDLAGINRAVTCLRSVNHPELSAICGNGSDIISGDAASGTIRFSLAMPQYSAQGDWNIYSVSIQDRAGQWLDPAPIDYQNLNLSQTGQGDSAAPTITGVTFDKTEINTSTSSQTVTATISFTDDLVGVDRVILWANSPSTGSTLYSQNQLYSGSITNGSMQITINFPQGSEQGTWTFSPGAAYDLTGKERQFNPTDTVTVTNTTPEPSVGDLYQGGIIVYILQPGDLGYATGSIRGFIAAPLDQSNAAWGCDGITTGANRTLIGTGYQNTLDIISACPLENTAAKIAHDYQGSGYTDWYLPSKDELHKLQLSGTPYSSGSDLAWTSTEVSSGQAYVERSNGQQGGTWKTYTPPYIHSIRSFGMSPLTVSGAPTNVTATTENAQSSVSFSVPSSDGGSSILYYTATSNPGNITATSTISPITVTGLSNGTAYTFTVTATNAIGASSPSVASNEVTPTAPGFVCGDSVPFNYGGAAVTYGSILSNGKCWLDRNLGAGGPGDYGDLFQWGRLVDGHQARDSATTDTKSSTDVPGHNLYIRVTASPYDWRNPSNGNLWQGVSGINNPCPSGWRLPTYSELSGVFTGITCSNGGPLSFTCAGYKTAYVGAQNWAGQRGHYWSSYGDAYFEVTATGNSASFSTVRSDANSVRCVKD